ncbi:hypothetical protein DSO57_1014643 [Entomophthora muscae]|uniref:Uncharacterized protein n=1 Tax=Entomophthora muscae TaxID=34485 RepID=A0ACC2RK42_9FUNG|nr:hypothetical protein DSO57_1014643 [Entomophthora muscae]
MKYFKGRLIERPLCIVRYISRQVWKLGYNTPLLPPCLSSDTRTGVCGRSGKVHTVRTDNFPPLEPQAQERKLNPEPGSPRAAGPEDRETACPHFSGIEPPRADVEEDDLPRKVDQAEESTALSEVPITTPNGGDPATIGLMSLKSLPATNQEPTQGRGTGPQLGPMTSMLKQDNQVAKLGAATNERTPGPSAILLPLDPSPQFPWPCLSQCPDDSHKKC